jgi:hypothetical protein
MTGSLRPSKVVVVVTVVLVVWVVSWSGKLGKGSLPPSRSRGFAGLLDEAISGR